MKIPYLFAFISFTFIAFAELPVPVPEPVSPGRVACVGDSITEGAGTKDNMSYPRQLQTLLGSQWTVKNFGVSGRTLLRKGNHPYWNEEAFQKAQDFKPDAVVILLGANDTKPQNWVYKDEFLSDYRDLVKIFQELPSKPRIYICRPCPVPAPGNFNIREDKILEEIPMIDELAHEMNLGVIDIHAALLPTPEFIPDRVHPNNDGAAVIARTVYQALTGKPAPDHETAPH